MFEKLFERAEARAQQIARSRTAAVAERLAAQLSTGIRAEAHEGGVRLSGRGLKRRLALESRLRWLIAELST